MRHMSQMVKQLEPRNSLNYRIEQRVPVRQIKFVALKNRLLVLSPIDDLSTCRFGYFDAPNVRRIIVEHFAVDSNPTCRRL